MREYRAVGNRCAVDLNSLQFSVSKADILLLLREKGFHQITVDLVGIARMLIGKSQYRRGARLYEAPDVVDCLSLIKWLYAQQGIWLPRRSIQQRELGEVVDLNDLIAGDVIFVSGWIDYYCDDPADGVGHVGIYTGEGTVVHAANKKINLVESSLNRFIGANKFRGARRYIPRSQEVITLEAPVEREIETSDDIRWIILQSMSRKS